MTDLPEATAPFQTRLQVLFARDAKRAVILRRGPKRHFNLITWDLPTDTFTPGQWMKGIVRLCDLSPNGDKLIYWAAQYHASAPYRDGRAARAGAIGRETETSFEPLDTPSPAKAHRRGRKVPGYMRGDGKKTKRLPPARANEGVWTAVSTPPYFSALAIWPCYGHWTGGGVFRSAKEIMLFEDEEGMRAVENRPIPARYRILPAWPAIRQGLEIAPCAFRPEFDKSDDYTRVSGALLRAGVKWVDWINLQAGNDLLFACDGCVFRLPKWRTLDSDLYLEKAWLLADLRRLSFQMIRAPGTAMRW